MGVDTAAQIVALDLRAAARDAIASGEQVRYELHPYAHNPSINVETLIIGGRAGQAINANAEWGDWDGETLTLDSGERRDLAARAVE